MSQINRLRSDESSQSNIKSHPNSTLGSIDFWDTQNFPKTFTRALYDIVKDEIPKRLQASNFQTLIEEFVKPRIMTFQEAEMVFSEEFYKDCFKKYFPEAVVKQERLEDISKHTTTGSGEIDGFLKDTRKNFFHEKNMSIDLKLTQRENYSLEEKNNQVKEIIEVDRMLHELLMPEIVHHEQDYNYTARPITSDSLEQYENRIANIIQQILKNNFSLSPEDQKSLQAIQDKTTLNIQTILSNVLSLNKEITKYLSGSFLIDTQAEKKLQEFAENLKVTQKKRKDLLQQEEQLLNNLTTSITGSTGWFSRSKKGEGTPSTQSESILQDIHKKLSEENKNIENILISIKNKETDYMRNQCEKMQEYILRMNFYTEKIKLYKSISGSSMNTEITLFQNHKDELEKTLTEIATQECTKELEKVDDRDEFMGYEFTKYLTPEQISIFQSEFESRGITPNDKIRLADIDKKYPGRWEGTGEYAGKTPGKVNIKFRKNHIEIVGVKMCREQLKPSKNTTLKKGEDYFEGYGDDKNATKYKDVTYWKREAAQKEVATQGKRIPTKEEYEMMVQVMPGEYKENERCSPWNQRYCGLMGFKLSGFRNSDGSWHDEGTDGSSWSSSEDDLGKAWSLECGDSGGDLDQDDIGCSFPVLVCED